MDMSGNLNVRARGKRPKGVLGVGWASIESAAQGRTEHRPIVIDYPENVIRRTTIEAGANLGWRLSALITPRPKPAPWKIVVVTGTPSWAEYWAPVMAALPPDREMVVVDRPGFAGSEPDLCVPDIRVQARALSSLLTKARGQKILLVGQSYGAAVATLMAADHPRQVDELALVSSYLGEQGATARWLVRLGSRFLNVLPRDLRHAVMEADGHAAQMPLMRAALARLRIPVHLIHGDQDDFAPIEVARRLSLEAPTRRPIRFEEVAGATHFLNDGPVDALISALEACIPQSPPRFVWTWPKLSLSLNNRSGAGLRLPA
jgi:pimeloyl-ACP methyl ester carboxylesterase